MVIGDAQHLLLFAVDFHRHQPLEASDAMVDMGYIVTGFQVIEVLEGDGLLCAEVVAQVITVVTFEDLVVGIAADFLVVVDEPRMDGNELPLEIAVQLIVVLDVVQDGLDAVQLLGTLRVEDDAIALRLVIVNVLNKQVEVLVENRLRRRMENSVS